MVLMNNVAPKVVTASDTKTSNTDCSAQDKAVESTRDTFKKQLSECVGINEGKQRSLHLDDANISSENKKDISMCCDSDVTELLNGIVGILEGFELLDNQITDNESKMQAAMAAILESVGLNQESIQYTNKVVDQVNADTGNVQEDGPKLPQALSEQFARMLQDSQPMNLPDKARQVITTVVDEYFSSFESTNNEKQPQALKLADIASMDVDKLNTMLLRAKTVVNKESASNMKSGQEKTNQPMSNAPVNETVHNVQAFEVQKGLAEAEKGVDIAKETQVSSSFVKDNVARIVDKMTAQAENGRHEFDIQLKPDYLGKLNIKLTMENGEMKMLIKTEELAVKGMFAEQLPSMQDALKEKGIVISNIDVVYDDQSFLNGQQQAFKQREGNSGNQRKWKSRQIVNAAADSIFYSAAMDTPRLGISGSSMEFHA